MTFRIFYTYFFLLILSGFNRGKYKKIKREQESMLKTNSKYLIIIFIELNMYERGGLIITEDTMSIIVAPEQHRGYYNR